MRPELNNTDRLNLLAEAIWGGRTNQRNGWEREVSRFIGVSQWTIHAMRKRRTYPENSRVEEPDDEFIRRLIAKAREKRDQLDGAIEECRLPPWIP